jgi:hypothetical protein
LNAGDLSTEKHKLVEEQGKKDCWLEEDVQRLKSIQCIFVYVMEYVLFAYNCKSIIMYSNKRSWHLPSDINTAVGTFLEPAYHYFEYPFHQHKVRAFRILGLD